MPSNYRLCGRVPQSMGVEPVLCHLLPKLRSRVLAMVVDCLHVPLDACPQPFQ